MDFIKRNYPAEFRADENGEGIVTGIPIVFNVSTDIGGYFEEVIASGAIDAREMQNDVRFFWNHNIEEKALARSVIPIVRKGGLEFFVTDQNVEMKANINLKRSDANDLYLSIQDGTINAMSFMFGVSEQKWERLDTDYPKRIITKISPVVEVSAVNFPAYKTTSINTARSDLSTEIDKRVLENMRKQARTESRNSINPEIKNLIYMYGGKM